MKRLALICVAVLAIAACKKKQSPAEGSGSAASDIVAGSGSAAGSDVAAGSGSAAGSDTAPDPAKAQIERGAYVAGLTGCAMCHATMTPKGPDFSHPFAGGGEVQETFGTWHPQNITPDPETGIGKWTDEQVMAAFREGKRPDGSQLYAIMPYPYYNRMTDDDAKAVVAFLRSQKPFVNKSVPNTDLKMPKIPMPPAANQPDPTDDMIKHGEYLATIMHCVMCHTPMTPKGPDMKRAFSGGFEFEIPMMGEGKIYSANITSDPDTGIGKYSTADIIKVLRTATKPDGSPVQGPMVFYVQGWSQLTDADAMAIAKYIQSIPPIKHKVPASTFKPRLPPPGAGAPPGAPPAAPPADDKKPG